MIQTFDSSVFNVIGVGSTMAMGREPFLRMRHHLAKRKLWCNILLIQVENGEIKVMADSSPVPSKKTNPNNNNSNSNKLSFTTYSIRFASKINKKRNVKG